MARMEIHRVTTFFNISQWSVYHHTHRYCFNTLARISLTGMPLFGLSIADLRADVTRFAVCGSYTRGRGGKRIWQWWSCRSAVRVSELFQRGLNFT